MTGRCTALFVALLATSVSLDPGAEAGSSRTAAGASTRAAALADARPLPFFYDLYTFRGTARSTVVVAAFAVKARELEQEPIERGVRYRFDVTLVLADTILRTVRRSDDSVYVATRQPFDGEHLLYTHIEVHAAPSASTLQRVIMSDATQPGIGQLYSTPYPVPDYSGSELMLSDIALGQPHAKSGWKRGDITLALLPTGQFPASAFDVYYEIYNLPARHHYATEIAVQRADSAAARHLDDRPVRIRFTQESKARADGTLAELRRVDTSLPPGRYRISVTITDEVTQQMATRSRVFEVDPAGRAATMVPALPRTGRR